MTIKLALQIYIFLFSILCLCGIFLDENKKIDKLTLFMLLNFIVIIVYIFNY